MLTAPPKDKIPSILGIQNTHETKYHDSKYLQTDRMHNSTAAEANKQLCMCTCYTASRSRRRCRIQQMRFASMPQTNNLQRDLRVGGSVVRAIHNPEASVAQSADDLVVVGIVLVVDRHLGVNLNTKDTANRMHIK
jgi:5-deoxy-D-glucuronate isomerase